jgi:single-strand DNA-binding protein
MAQMFDTFRIGNDPELRYLGDGTAVCNLSLAFNYGKKDQQGKRPTQWVDAVLWGKHAEAVAEYLFKGSEVTCVIDDPHVEQFTKGDGSLGTKLTGRISTLKLVGGQPQQQNQQQQQQRQQQQRPASNGQQTARPQQQQGSSGNQQQRQQQAAPQPQPDFDSFDDDIPF